MIFVCPASSSVSKVAQRSSPSDPRVLVWLPPVGQYPSPVGDHRPRHRGRRHQQLTLTTAIVLLAGAMSHTSELIGRKENRRRQSPNYFQHNLGKWRVSIIQYPWGKHYISFCVLYSRRAIFLGTSKCQKFFHTQF